MMSDTGADAGPSAQLNTELKYHRIGLDPWMYEGFLTENTKEKTM